MIELKTKGDDFLNPKEFGEYIKNTRIESGYNSQRQLASISGISNGTIARIESGSHLPSPATLSVLSQYLKDVDYLDLMVRAGYLAPETQLGVEKFRSAMLGENIKETKPQKMKRKNEIIDSEIENFQKYINDNTNDETIDLNTILDKPNIVYKEHLLINKDRQLIKSYLEALFSNREQ